MIKILSSLGKLKNIIYPLFSILMLMMITSIIPVSAISCDCVIFRFVDVQDFFLTTPRVDVMDTFIDQNEKVSLSILLNSVGSDAAIVNKVAQGQQSGHFELTLHGFNHEDFTGFDFEGQKNLMELSQVKMNDTWGINSSSFVPPMHQFNNDTLQVMRDLDISIISSGPQGIDPPENIKFIANPPSNITDSFGNYHLPQTAEFKDHGTIPHTKILHDDIMTDVNDSIAVYGYSVLNLYGTDFAQINSTTGNFDNITNSTEINDLLALINAIRTSGYNITTFEEITQAASLPTTASLTVIKNVVNDNTGTNVPGDFTMVITANNPSSNNFAGVSGAGTTITIDPGSYSVDETGPGGYGKTLSSECSGTAVAGEFYICTVTNDDVAPTTAALTVIKNVVNDDSGTNVPSDFTMVITATNPSDNNFAGNSTGTTITIDPGEYSVDESGPGGYGKTLSSECSGTAVPGLSYTCTITNADGFCDIPESGDWAITEDCTLLSNSSAPANVIVQNNSILTIPIGVTLEIDFSQFNLTVEFGSGALIKSGGTIT